MNPLGHTISNGLFLWVITMVGLCCPVCNAQTTLFVPFPTATAPPAANPPLSADILGIDNNLGRTTWALHDGGQGEFVGTALLVEGANYASIGNTAFQAQCTFGAGGGQPAVCSGYLVAPTPTSEGNGIGPPSTAGGGPLDPGPPVRAVIWTEPVSYVTVLAGTTADGVVVATSPNEVHPPTSSTKGLGPASTAPSSGSNPGSSTAGQTSGHSNEAIHVSVGLLVIFSAVLGPTLTW